LAKDDKWRAAGPPSPDRQRLLDEDSRRRADEGARTVRGYRLLAIIGRGGMGVVWQARHLDDDREVAIKCIRETGGAGRSAQLLQRLVREAKIMSRLQHRNIVGAVEWFSMNDEFYLVLERVDGEALSTWLRGEPEPALAARLDVMRQVVAAVAYAHDQGVIHRDLKPSNVMVAPGPTAKVLDFGLARALDSTRLTRTGLVLGTLVYMAPEQARGKQVDERADVFALGIMLARCLGAERPFLKESTAARYSSLVSADPVELDDWLPDDVRRVLERAVAKDPEQRVQSASELGSLLDELFGDPEAVADRLDRARREPAARPRQRLARIERPAASSAVSDVLARHSSRRGSLVVVLGSPGSGRSTVLSEIGERLRAGGVESESLRFVAGAVPHIAVHDLIRQREERVNPDRGSPADGPTATSVDSHLSTAEAPLEELLASFLAETEEMAREGTLALLFDDVQYAAPAELSWIGRLAADTRDLQLVLVVAGDVAREGAPLESADAYAEFLTRLAADDDVIRVPLSPLPRELVAERLAASGVPEDSAHELAAQSGANPAVLNLLLDRWHRGASIADAVGACPSDYISRLSARFQRLDPPAAALVRALVGADGRVELTALLETTGLARLAATSRLRELEHKHGWLRLEDGVVHLTQPYLAAVDLDSE